MVAFLVPLLTMLGLKVGIIGTLTTRLLQDPRNLQITPYGGPTYDEEFFQKLSSHPDAAFIIPGTRTTSATIALKKPGFAEIQPNLSATAKGDPLLKDAKSAIAMEDRDLEIGEVFVSQRVAEKLDLKPGDTVTGITGRIVDKQDQYASTTLKVLGVVPSYITTSEAVFSSLAFLVMTEDFRSNGYGVPELGWPGIEKPPGIRPYPNFRLYAKNLDGVDRLRRYLMALMVETNTKAAEIERVKNIDRSFTVVFYVLLVVVGLGAFVSSASSSLDQVAKMRRSLSVLALLGFNKSKLFIFTVFQGVLTGLLAALVSEGVFLGVSKFINSYFGSSLQMGDRICVLLPNMYITVIALTTAFMTASSACAYYSLSTIEPSEGMRDV
jgi:putative ABC transport system permease protein